MKTIKNSLTPEQVVEILCKMVTTVGSGWIDINEAADYVCSQTLVSPIDVPHFSRSKVDGYVVSKKDLYERYPLVLKKTYLVPAGSVNKYSIEPGNTVKVMTGAPVPLNAGAVIKQEEVKEQAEEITIIDTPVYNANLEFAGSVIKKGQVLAYSGQRYTPKLIEYIATTGINQVPIYNKPSVYIINSGSELVLPGNNLQYGKIYNSNQSMLLSLLKSEGCNGIAGCDNLADDIELICEEIKRGISISDLVIITGGNSEGDYDLVPQALEKIGADIIVRGIEMKPGRRTVIAGYENKLIFNVPGNPHAGFILFQVLIKPVLKKMCGDLNPANQWFNLRLINNINKTKFRVFMQGVLVPQDNALGAMAVNPYGFQEGLAPLILDIAPSQGDRGDIIKAMLLI